MAQARPPHAGMNAHAGPGERRLLRVITLNLWGAQPPLDERLAAASAGLRALDPDVVLLQEVRCGQGLANTAERLAAALGKYEAIYRCATAGGRGTWGPGSLAGEEGLAVLTRLPVLAVIDRELPESRPQERRILLSVQLDASALPGPPPATGASLWCHTTHLHWRLRDGIAREQQVVAIDEAIEALGREHVHVLGGDLNAAPDCDEIRFLAGRATLAGRRTYYQDAWSRVHPGEPGWTWVRRNPHTAALSWLDLDRRIDYIFVSTEKPDGRGHVTEAHVVLDGPGPGGTWPSDHLGVLAVVAV